MGISLTTNNSVLNEFEDSHVSNVFQSDPEINEQNFPIELKDYLYEKNLIIFLIDTAKKVKICEGKIPL